MEFWKRLRRRFLFEDATVLVRKARTRILHEDDMLPLPAAVHPRGASDDPAIDWSDGRRLVWTLLRSARGTLTGSYSFYAVSMALGLAQPLLVNKFVGGIAAGESFGPILALAVALGATSFLRGSVLQQYFYGTLVGWQRITNAINERLYLHALKMTGEARQGVPVGDIVNHMSSDSDMVAESALFVAEAANTVVMIVGVAALMFVFLGWTAVVPLVLLALLAPATKWISGRFSRLEEEMMRERDRRVTLMSQILGAIRVVKSFAWERSVAAEVAGVRVRELEARRRLARAEVYSSVTYVAVSSIVLFSALATHVWRGFALDPALVFTVVSLFTLVEEPFGNLSWVLSRWTNAFVGARRISAFLKSATLEPRAPRPSSMESALAVRVGSFRAAGGKEFVVRAGESVALVGPVGGGKSTILSALLGEDPSQRRSVEFRDAGGRAVAARTAYVPQEAYIVNGSLRENIAFGEDDVSDERVARAVFAASFESDLQELPAGLATEIGEKGVNLSGGQKQRVALARAALRDPQVVFLDDPLSAVDVETERRLCDRLLFGLWSGKTRVAATHRLENLRRFDRILFIEDGRIAADGTFDELIAASGRFRSFMRDHELTHGDLDVGAPSADAAVAVTKQAESRITEDEEREVGAVKGSVYWDYFRSLGGEGRAGAFNLALLLAGAFVVMAFPLLSRWWLGASSSAQLGARPEGPAAWLEASFARAGFADALGDPMRSVLVYGAFGLAALVFGMISGLFWLHCGLRAGRVMHDRMLESLLRATLRFFDSTPVGRVLQRFSRDVEAVDLHLQRSFEQMIHVSIEVLLCLALIAWTVPWAIVAVLPVLWIYNGIQNDYRRPAREAKRLDSIARSPRFAHFKETLTGLPVIRGFGREDWFVANFHSKLAHSQRMFYSHFVLNRWFSARVPLIGGAIAMATTVTIAILARSGSIDAATAGLLTIYMLSFWGYLNWGIRMFADIESRMTSVERMRVYSNLPAERETVLPRETPVRESWPERGEVVFENVAARYASHLPLVLRGVSFRAAPGERVGLIGRTGSGKSTLLQALFRFVELESGRILVDGEDIASVPLERLRRSLAIIPQDPTLFLGTIRSNLDRYGEYADDEIRGALEKASMLDFVRDLPDGLAFPIVENGMNLSQGQRQLLCLARALLTGAKVIVFDEATASVDVETDAVLQRVIHRRLEGVTLLIIAHRLGTVSACGKVVELAGGRAVAELQPSDATRELAAIESEERE